MSLEELFNILVLDNPGEELLRNESKLFELIPELEKTKGFNQNSPWHPYDVYTHILNVVINTKNDLETRLAALFHDIGKPDNYTEDENHIGHFYGHWLTSVQIFECFALKYNFDEQLKKDVSNLIFYHDLNVSKLDDYGLDEFVSSFDLKNMRRLFDLKRADLKAQSKDYYYLLNDIDKQENMVLEQMAKYTDTK